MCEKWRRAETVERQKTNRHEALCNLIFSEKKSVTVHFGNCLFCQSDDHAFCEAYPHFVNCVHSFCFTEYAFFLELTSAQKGLPLSSFLFFLLLFLMTCSSFQSQPILMLLSFNFDVVNFCVNPNPVLKILLFSLFSVVIVCRIVCLNIALLLKACTRTTSVVPCWKSQSHTSNAPCLFVFVLT